MYGAKRALPVGNRPQKGQLRKPLKHANRQPVATHGNRFGAHGKEGVSGSSPDEGFNLRAVMSTATAVAAEQRLR